MVVSAGTHGALENAALIGWLVEHRRARTESIIARLRAAQAAGELTAQADVAALGDCYATLLHGLSVQARDGVGAARLLAMIPAAMAAFDMAAVHTARSGSGADSEGRAKL